MIFCKFRVGWVMSLFLVGGWVVVGLIWGDYGLYSLVVFYEFFILRVGWFGCVFMVGFKVGRGKGIYVFLSFCLF